MATKNTSPSIRILPDGVSNKIAAGEVVERPASVVKELVENALDADATRISVRVVAAGRRLIEVVDNGYGMSEQNALLAIERHATSKISKASDLEAIRTMGFRGEALASIASVSRFQLVTRRAKDESATRLCVDGGILRKVEQTGGPVGTRVSVNRLYFNTPVRAKFLKGITTELGHCIDLVQRHCLARPGVGFQFFHNEKTLLDIPEHATLHERIALIWGLNFSKDMTDLQGEQAGFTLHGVIGKPGLTRAQRAHQFFFMNGRPVENRSLQYGFEDGYHGLLTIGRHPVGIVLLETHPRFVDVNVHPTKREIRFRDERAARDAIRDIVRESLSTILPPAPSSNDLDAADDQDDFTMRTETENLEHRLIASGKLTPAPPGSFSTTTAPPPLNASAARSSTPLTAETNVPPSPGPREAPAPVQTDIYSTDVSKTQVSIVPDAVYEPVAQFSDAPMQLFDTYLLVPDEERLLIIDQHALHERLNYDSLLAELEDTGYQSQQLAVPIVVEVAPSQVSLIGSNLDTLKKVGLETEPFGGNTFQVTAICHLYEESKVRDLVLQVLDELAQGDLFETKDFMTDVLRLATRACKASVKAGDRLTPQERKRLLDGFRLLRPPYTCPHGRPIIIELTQRQMEKSFRRTQ